MRWRFQQLDITSEHLNGLDFSLFSIESFNERFGTVPVNKYPLRSLKTQQSTRRPLDGISASVSNTP